MDYEKAYKEALKRARKLYKDAITLQLEQDIKDYEQIFPELKESEDERIRKDLLAFIKAPYVYDFIVHDRVDPWIDWLEKQGKQFSAIRWYDASLIPQEMEELLVEWDSEDATWHEIAFYHSDTKTFWNGTRQVENVTKWCYIIDLLEKQGTPATIDVDKMVLKYSQTRETCTNGLPVNCQIRAYRQGINDILEKQGKPKQEWSEADENRFQNIIACIEDCYNEKDAQDLIRWFKSLRHQPK